MLISGKSINFIFSSFLEQLFFYGRIPSAISPQFDCMIFMISRSIATSSVSCEAGNKNNFPFWILICLFSRFSVTPFIYLTLLFSVIHPSSI
ncbi:hypothetical protein L2E82_07065 [Cichorium intybus]|uniref:Uncharacterized protein n=1 Tax=Cichorium intybus TaxID=13427 RepID=A0ACB9G3P8_CICIN|nr:hypothetical protein L2E82_07065 [Cichorium intybus]